VQTKAPWWIGPILALAVVVAFAWFVWPTRWESLTTDPDFEVRKHRLTGEVEARMPRQGWREWTAQEGWPGFCLIPTKSSVGQSREYSKWTSYDGSP
jgi:hypothetical protein